MTFTLRNYHTIYENTHNTKKERYLKIFDLTGQLSNRTTISPRATSPTFIVNDLIKAYRFPAGNGLGRKIGIIQLGGGFILSDLEASLKMNNILTMPILNLISIDGAQNTPGLNASADSEVALDLQIAATVAPMATFNIYFCQNSPTSFYNGIARAISDGCTIVSISWGAPEFYWPNDIKTQFNELFKEHANKGVVFLVASGDFGSSDGLEGNNVDFPGSCPYAVSCGGTNLIVERGSIIKETVWNTGTHSSTGGGYSQFFGRPDYQTTNKYNTRGVPDISACADPYTGYIIIMNGQQSVIGGTSAVAPLLAGLFARLPPLTTLFHPILYSRAGSMCRDITAGTNGSFSASKGWDPTTGNGSPIASSWQKWFK